MLAVALVRRIHLSPIIGYLLLGAAIGPHTLGLLPEGDLLSLLAEIGVVLLLFMIGLEFSLTQLLAMKAAVFGLGGGQVLVTSSVAAVLAHLAGMPWPAAVVAGGIVAMSSTAIAVSQLTEQMEIQTRHGRAALAILLFQDLAVVPLLVVIPILAGDSGGTIAVPLMIALLKAVAAFAILIACGHWLLRPLFHAVAGAASAELFTLTTLAVALAAAWLTFQLGLSLALGAFLAGMMLSETQYRHQIEVELRPFRDVLMGLFFITIGLRLDITGIPAHAPWVALLVIGLVLGKGVLIALLMRLSGYENGVALRTGMVLGQAGEFGFALLALAISERLIGPDAAQPILAAMIISMALAPLMIRYNGTVALKLFAGSYLRGHQATERELESAAETLDGHVIICGFGYVGQNLARFLHEEGLRYIAMDLNPQLIQEARDAGEPVFYADSRHGEILQHAGLGRASVMVVTFTEASQIKRILHAARTYNDTIPIVVRTRDDSQLEALEAAGATYVIPETIEASMTLATHLLNKLNIPQDEVLRLVTEARMDHYRSLRGYFHGQDQDEKSLMEGEALHTVVITHGAHAADHSLGELGLEDTSVIVKVLRRGPARIEFPARDVRIREGDAIVLKGPADRLPVAERQLLLGKA